MYYERNLSLLVAEFWLNLKINAVSLQVCVGRDRLVVRTPRCGRGNPGSNPGHGKLHCIAVCVWVASREGGRHFFFVGCVD